MRTQQFFARFHVKKTDRHGRICTHTFMSGGAYIVEKKTQYDDEQILNEQMFSAMEQDIRAGIPIYVNEIASDMFRLYLDLDIYHDIRLSDSEIGDMVRMITECATRFYPSNANDHPNGRIFEVIALDAATPVLCQNIQQLSDLMEPVPLFNGQGFNVIVLNEKIAHPKTGDWLEVLWLTLPAADGTYRAQTQNGHVMLSTVGNPAFEQINVRKDKLVRCIETNIVPNVALPVDRALQTFGETFTADTVFSLGDDEFFRNQDRNESGHVKHGIHIIFPNLHVNLEQALYIRAAVVECFTNAYGKKYAPKPEGFYDVIDSQVYGPSKGLRMCGSSKMGKCSICNGIKAKDTPACNACQGSGKANEGRPYVLHSAYINGERHMLTENDLRNNLNKLLKRTSIRVISKDTTPNWSVYPKCPQIGNMVQISTKKDGSIDKKIFKQPVFTDKKWSGNIVEVTDPNVFSMFEKYIRRWKCYSKLRVTSVKRTEKGFYFIAVAGEGMHWCLNKNPPGDHRSNTIYFQCDFKSGLCARCRSTKQTTEGRRKGLCCNFCSEFRTLDGPDKTSLFPDQSRKSRRLL